MEETLSVLFERKSLDLGEGMKMKVQPVKNGFYKRWGSNSDFEESNCPLCKIVEMTDIADLYSQPNPQICIQTNGCALVHILVEDCCYTVLLGTEEDLKIEAQKILLNGNENSELEYYHNGKRKPLKVEIEI